MVHTRPRNKAAHPGLVDVQTNQQPAPRKENSSKSTGTSAQIDALEATLLAEKHERLAAARELPGPSIAKQSHARMPQSVSLITNREVTVDTGTYTFVCLTSTLMRLILSLKLVARQTTHGSETTATSRQGAMLHRHSQRRRNRWERLDNYTVRES